MKRILLVMTILSMSVIFSGCGDSEKAKLRRVAQLNEEVKQALQNKNFDQAQELLEQVLVIEPENQVARNNLAYIYVSFNNDLDKAEEIWIGLYEQFPANASYMNNLGSIYFTKNEYDKAIELYTKAKKNHSNYHLPFYNLGHIYNLKGEYQKAITELNQGLKLSPTDSQTILMLVQSYTLMGEQDAAKNFLVKKCKRPKIGADVRLKLVKYLKRDNQFAEAEKQVDTVLRNWPTIVLARAEKIELALLKKVKTETIQELLQQYQTLTKGELDPWYPQFVEARIACLNGDKDTAEENILKLDGKIPPKYAYFEGIRQLELEKIFKEKDDLEQAQVAHAKAMQFAPELFTLPKPPKDAN